MQSNEKIIYNASTLQAAVRDYLHDVGWHAPYGVTLHFKRVRYLKVEPYVQHLTPDAASQNVRHFLNLLSRQTIGCTPYKYGKRLQVVAVAEQTGDGILHYHLQIECPKWELEPAFADLIQRLWSKTHWGAECHVDRYVDPGWVNYITKRRSKPCFADAIDWQNTSGPIRRV